MPQMLVNPAKEAGIMCPEDPDNYEKNDFQHFFVFCNMQLWQPMPYPSVHWDNAKIIASIPKSKITSLNKDQIINLGFNIGYSK